MVATFRALCIAALAALSVSCASGEGFVKPGYDFSQVKKCAVIEVALSGIPKTQWQDYDGLRGQIGDMVTEEFFKKGYDMIERTQITAVMKEQDFQGGDRTSSQGAAAIGKLLNVPAVIIVNVTEFGENISISSKMIETESGMLLWMGHGTGSRHSGMSTLVGGLLGAGAGAGTGAAVGGREGAVIGGVAGGMGGLVVGRLMEPQTAEIARDCVGEMCESVPMSQ